MSYLKPFLILLLTAIVSIFLLVASGLYLYIGYESNQPKPVIVRVNPTPTVQVVASPSATISPSVALRRRSLIVVTPIPTRPVLTISPVVSPVK